MPGYVYSVAYNTAGTRIVAAADNGYVYDAVDGSLLGTLNSSSDFTFSVAFSPDDSLIAAGYSSGNIRIWNANVIDEKGLYIQLREFAAHTNNAAVRSIAFSPDGLYLASGGDDKVVRVWETATISSTSNLAPKFQSEFKNHTNTIVSVAFSRGPNNNEYVVASSAYEKMVFTSNALTGEIIGTLKNFQSSSYLTIALSPDGKYIVGAEQDFLVVCDAATGAQVGKSTIQHSGCIRTVAFSRDGKQIVSCGDDATVCIWDVTISS
jgi:WD40 repeat protein